MTAALFFLLFGAGNTRQSSSKAPGIPKITFSAEIYPDSVSVPPSRFLGNVFAQIFPIRPQSVKLINSDVYLEGEGTLRVPVKVLPIRRAGVNDQTEFEIKADYDNWPHGLAKWRGSFRVEVTGLDKIKVVDIPVDTPIYLPDNPVTIDRRKVGTQFLKVGAMLKGQAYIEDLDLFTLAETLPSGDLALRSSSGKAVTAPPSNDLVPIREDASLRTFRDKYAGRTVYFRRTCEAQMNPREGRYLKFGFPYRIVGIYRLAAGYVRVALRHAQMPDATKQIVAGDPYLVAVKPLGSRGNANLFTGLFAGSWQFDRVASFTPPPRAVINRAKNAHFDNADKGMPRSVVAWLNGYPGDELSVPQLNRLGRWYYQELTPFSWGVTFKNNRVRTVSPPGDLP